FGDVVVWIHSKMSVGERYNAWKLSNEGKYRIVIGPRSALFAPLRNIGLIIVDEEHEASYKQFDSVPRYHARDAAIVKALLNKSVVVLGSATPSLESYFNAQSGKYTLLTLPERADNATLPPVEIVNMIEERKRNFAEKKLLAKTIGKAAFDNFSKSISILLEQKIRDRLQKHEKTILLQNRRGFAPFLECADCGYIEQCDRCSVTMTYHAPQRHLRCHYCGKIKHPPTDCPKCHGHRFEMRGFGTQRVEEELSLLFPDARILRMDLDTTTGKNAHEKILQQFGKGNADILLGTQMVAKGLDFPEVTLVGVISADTQMMLPDFRSAERTFQLLTQVAGRAGRSVLQGEVIIQTSQPEHYALAHVQDHDYTSFYREEIEYRKALGYPPFSRIILIEIKGQSENKVQTAAEQVGKSLQSKLRNATMLGPAPAALAKIKNDYRWQIIVKVDKDKDRNAAHAREVITSIVQQAQQSSQNAGSKIFIDVDPAGIM
ncbi:MAG: primosomal protein N', partial [Bacteroidota bacterium]